MKTMYKREDIEDIINVLKEERREYGERIVSLDYAYTSAIEKLYRLIGDTDRDSLVKTFFHEASNEFLSRVLELSLDEINQLGEKEWDLFVAIENTVLQMPVEKLLILQKEYETDPKAKRQVIMYEVCEGL